MDKIGIATIAIGEKARLENKLCIESVKRVLPDIDIITIDYTNNPVHLLENDMILSRLIKCDLINLIPQNWQYCLYLDSDTRLRSSDILVFFEILKSGYDLVICPSKHSDFWHIGENEKEHTFNKLGYTPLQLQFGVFAFSVNPKMRKFFLRLSNEYMLYCNQDQAALVRTLHDISIRYWLMGYPFNSSNGSVVTHLFGRTR